MQEARPETAAAECTSDNAERKAYPLYTAAGPPASHGVQANEKPDDGR